MPRALTLALLVCALLFRVIMPSGWMPVSDAQGLHIVICTGTGPVELAAAAVSGPQKALIAAMHHSPRTDDHRGADHPCVFSGLGLALAEPRLPELAMLPIPLTFAFLAATRTVTVGHGLAAPPPPATGPPLLA